MHIIGTAGHVDHGKSTLIAALTGTHPDRLKEEKVREMTIELGFASLSLPNGEEVGIIDVPGHRDFIGNMLAGIGGIDAVLLVVAADEGVSAQTREHLSILDLLEINRGVIVLTKTDLVDDREWLELVEMDVQELLSRTSLADAPIVPLSAKTGDGVPELLLALQDALVGLPERKNLGKPRLPVDRVFTLTGFGTIVTGTLLDGSFALGEEVVCLPGGKTGRIRGLQNHHHKVQKIDPGYRTAVNIVNLNYRDITRGDVIAHPRDYKPTQFLDAHFRLLRDSMFAVKHNMQVKMFIGSTETTATLRLLGTHRLDPGDTAYIQLRADNPIVAARGDRFILRMPSPSETLGGGVVLDPHPQSAYKRFNLSNLERMDKILSGSASELVSQILESQKTSSFSNLGTKSALPKGQLLEVLKELIDESQIVSLQPDNDIAKNTFMSRAYWDELSNKSINALNHFHQAYPFKAGMPREELKSSLGLSQVIFDLALSRLAEQGLLVARGSLVWAPGHIVVLTPAQEATVAPILADFSANPFTPPDINQVHLAIGADLLEGLISSGRLVAVSDTVLFTPTAIAEMQTWVHDTIQSDGSVSLAQLRDQFNTTRKYATAALEYFDSIGFTYRKGDVRGLR
ncbi:MAG: selenocysteine-specific translation elongation factor [Chloroflexi bacterium]|jgi:selenocysteine-specific elongation factor|nr:selenocysteine-specific translation elongation factor [Chloroflexota bacterium]